MRNASQRSALESTQHLSAGSPEPVQPLEWALRPYRPDEDLDALCELSEAAQQFSPLVGLETLDAELWAGRQWLEPQSLLLDVTGISHLFGGEPQLLAAVSRWLRSQRYFAYLAIASNIGAAWAFANYELRRASRAAETTAQADEALEDTPKDSENCDSDASTPDAKSSRANDLVLGEVGTGLDWLPYCRCLATEVWEEEEVLAALPIAALRIEQTTIDKLNRLGVRTLASLWQLPRAGLASRLGPQLMKRSDQALGILAEPIVTVHCSPDWIVQQEIEFPTRDALAIETVVGRLCAELAQRLARQGEGAIRIVCRLDIVRKPPVVLQLGLYRATYDSEHLCGLLVGQLEQTLQQGSGAELLKPARGKISSKPNPLKVNAQAIDEEVVEQAGVWRISVQATLTAPVVWEQSELFEDGERQQRQQLARLVDKLSSRLGRDRVLEARVERNAEPELAVSFRPMTGRRRDGTQEKTLRKLNSRLAHASAEPMPSDPLRRPTRLVVPPELLHGVVQTDDEGAPTSFLWSQRQMRVVLHWGPERLESGWWRGPSVRREYYRLECDGGEWLWVFKDLTTRQWFLSGLFS